jgi:hypothetical protein
MRGMRYNSPFIPTLTITWRWVVIFTPGSFICKNTRRCALNRRLGGPQKIPNFLENKSFLPHRISHLVCPVLQLISLSLQRFCYGDLHIRARMETFITQSHSLATHLCFCVINFQRRGKKWQMQLKLKNSLGNKLDVLKITFSRTDFWHICMFIRIFFELCNRTYSDKLKKLFYMLL